MKKFRLGRHINTMNGFVTAPEYAYKIGCTFFQIFLGPPQQIIIKQISEKELIEFADELEKYDLEMVIHGGYVINFCQPLKSKLHNSAIKRLVIELNTSHLIGKRCVGVIIHMGKNIKSNNISDQQAMDNYIQSLKITLSKTPNNTYIILETGASQGTEVASKIDGLDEIYWSLNEKERDRIKFCIDTCHIWATGYDISTAEGVKKYFDEFNEKIGIDKIACIHFNDSKTNLNSCVDRHEDLGYGYIGEKGLKEVAFFAKKNKIPLLMETPLDSVNMKTNRDITFEEELNKINVWIK